MNLKTSPPPKPSWAAFPRFHKGFYDLLNLIPNTASSLQRGAWSDVPEDNRSDHTEDIGGARYEELPVALSPPPKHTSLPGAFPNPSRRVLDKTRPTVALESHSVGGVGGLGATLSTFFTPAAPPKQARAITKDMISSPTGFVCVC